MWGWALNAARHNVTFHLMRDLQALILNSYLIIELIDLMRDLQALIIH